MIKTIQIFITLIFTSFFFFPFFFTFLPTINTKMMMAAAGGAVLLVKLARGENARIDKDFLILSLCALAISFASFLSMTINDTPDDSYLSYAISMWVWLSAAYFVANAIKWTHGTVSVELFCFYLIGVGVSQCILAISIDQNSTIKVFIDSILDGYGYMGKNETRLYGLGCALDVAGSRFAALLIMIAFLLPRVARRSNGQTGIILLLAAFFIISIIGNIIGRTTTVGMVLALIYLGGRLIKKNADTDHSLHLLRNWVLAFFILAISSSILLYQTNAQWRNYFEFGFEGFFSLAQTGEWDVKSNDMLKSHYVFPDNFRTWVIGDGRMTRTDIDPYYTGEHWGGFYKGSDAGYVRFIFYFGLIGLTAFSGFMLKVGQICYKRFWNYRYMFLMFIALNFIIWFKVSTDIFLVFAPFLCISQEEEEIYLEHTTLKDS